MLRHNGDGTWVVGISGVGQMKQLEGELGLSP